MAHISLAGVALALLVMVTAIQLFYLLYFFYRLAYYKAPEKRSFQQHPVSAIVCAKNEAATIALTVQGLVFQQYGSTVEIVVVNDRSTDGTAAVLQLLQETYKNIRVVTLDAPQLHPPGKKYPLSIGIKESRHELLLLTDADCVPATEHWLQKMQDAYDDDTEIVLGYGAYHKHKGVLNKLIRFETFHTALQYFSYALAGRPYMGVGRNMSYRKELFYRHKGFKSISHLPGGDDDLFISKAATKKNTKIVTDPDTFTLSAPPRSWAAWWRQKTRHYSTAKYYKPEHKFLLGCYSAAQFLFYPLLLLTAIAWGWWPVAVLYVIKMAAQYLVMAKAMKKLQEADLIPWIFLLDIWQGIYYLLFLPAVFKKEKNKW